MSKYRKTLESDADVFVCGASDDLMDVYVNGVIVEEFDIDGTSSRGSLAAVTPDGDVIVVTVHFDDDGNWTADVVAKNGDVDASEDGEHFDITWRTTNSTHTFQSRYRAHEELNVYRVMSTAKHGIGERRPDDLDRSR